MMAPAPWRCPARHPQQQQLQAQQQHLQNGSRARLHGGRAGAPAPRRCAVQPQQQQQQQQQQRARRAAAAPGWGRPALPHRSLRAARAVRVLALDAAQPFDYEHRARQQLAKEQRLSIGIVGFGTFGQFLARRMAQAGHRVLATSRSPYHDQAKAMGVEFYQDVDDFCEEHPDVVVLCSSILSTADVLRSLPVQRLKRNTLFVDVLSVKAFPKQLLLRELPPEMDILCTHPMFGPDSGKGSWKGLNFMYEVVRCGHDSARLARVENFLRFFRSEGCRMVEMSCEEHDRQAASTQFITHTVGRILGAMDVSSTDINTKGFDALLNLVENTSHDSFDLYYGLFLYNANATEELQRLEQAFDRVKKQLLGRMHDIVRQQLQLPDASNGVGAVGGATPGSGSGAASEGGSGSSRAASPSPQPQAQARRLLGPAAPHLELGPAAAAAAAAGSGAGEALQVEVLAPEQRPQQQQQQQQQG